jgi:ABC-type multidrug transport system fused ATPase/permease subunit
MAKWEDALVRAGGRVLGFPPGVGALLSRAVRRRLLLSIAGSVLVSGLDMLGVLALLPMMQFIAGSPPDQGALGAVRGLLGEPSDTALIGALAGMVAGAFITKDIVAILFRRWQLRFMAEQEVEVSRRLFKGYLVGPYAWHLVKNTSDKLWTVDYAVGIGFTVGFTAALGAVTEVLTITLLFLSLVFVSPVIALAALVYFGVAGLVMQRWLRPRVVAAGAAAMMATKGAAKIGLEAMGAVKEVKLRRAHDRFVEEFVEARLRGARARASSTLLNELPKYLLEIIFVGGIGLLALAVVSTSGAQDALVLLGVFVAAGSRILPSAVRLLAAIGGIRYSRNPLKHLVVEHHHQVEAERAELAEVTTDLVPTGDITVEDLRFSFSDEPDSLVLRGVDCLLPEGQTIAVVGTSGAGKSTFVDLLLGLHRPTSGTILAGGIDIRSNLPAWQSQVAVVPQDVYLLDQSLETNIAFNEDVDAERMADALRRAQLTDLVASLPAGLDTVVGDRGVRLSGGQRQRIGIARALYRRPRVLFLDEATSALDNETERRLSETIAALRGSMTIIIVAHRLSTVRDCDLLLFMSGGRVISHGTFDDVARDNAEFAHLVALGSLTRDDERATNGLTTETASRH